MVIFHGILRKKSPTKHIQEYLSSPNSFFNFGRGVKSSICNENVDQCRPEIQSVNPFFCKKKCKQNWSWNQNASGEKALTRFYCCVLTLGTFDSFSRVLKGFIGIYIYKYIIIYIYIDWAAHPLQRNSGTWSFSLGYQYPTERWERSTSPVHVILLSYSFKTKQDGCFVHSWRPHRTHTNIL